MSGTLILSPKDDVAIALCDLAGGDTVSVDVEGKELVLHLSNDIPKGHKVAIRAISAGRHVHKFGYSIGLAQKDIAAGEWVHTHNLRTGLSGLLDYQYEPIVPGTLPSKSLTFEGYERANGEAGIRNEIWILNTVGCINKTCEQLARLASNQFHGRGIDGVFHFAHPFGCSQLGDDLAFTQRLLTSLAEHGNAAGVLIVGLGCENNQIDAMKGLIDDPSGKRIRFLKCQEEADELETGLILLEELVIYAETFERKTMPMSKLKIGLKCGGSDGFSGITANPLVGTIADAIVAEGGTALLTEVPEMFGAETILMNRAQDEAVFRKVVGLINDFKQYFIRHNQEIYENPSPGNKSGGITTLEEKSLGCTQKGGQAIVTDVLPYAVRSVTPGLNLIQSPGNDLVSVTALAAAGAHLVLFTTGRGTPFGGPVPTVKLSTNSELALKKRNWIDFNAGRLLEGRSMNALTNELLDYVIQLASGTQWTHNEENGFREIAIFKDGVIL
ncbi:altronate dehydratase [Cohnella pontilimi]|uniref:Altronate dehydratase n=1 Tax=Cohnella pontilimi TaxID=2564100 RepID=A0A4U0FGS4_9BACL|nr:altronate dehydratase family protein [Cohnella pontilimi]TJY44131.1 altronate dehydratase [Cohnella pontilimi]